MQHPAFWKEAQDGNYHAIQQIMIFEEGIKGGIFMTPEEYYDAHKRATYDAWNDIAKQIVSGRTTNISVDGDGGVSDPTTGGGSAGLPVDNPDTPTINEELEARAGGGIFVVNKLDKILSDMHSWYASGTITEQNAADRLELIYEFESAKATTFANYWYTVWMNSQFIDLLDDTLDSLFFCKGMTIATFARYIFEFHTTAAEIPVLETFGESLTQSQLDSWFLQGSAVPSKAYETYSCTKIDNEQVILNMSTAEIVQVTTAGVWKQNHRFRATISGSFTDSDNPNIVRDFFWEHNTSTGVKTFRNTNGFISGGTSGAHSAAEVPFEPSHNYNVIIQKDGSTGQCIVSCDNVPFNLPSTIGSITIDIEDLGEFTI